MRPDAQTDEIIEAIAELQDIILDDFPQLWPDTTGADLDGLTKELGEMVEERNENLIVSLFLEIEEVFKAVTDPEAVGFAPHGSKGRVGKTKAFPDDTELPDPVVLREAKTQLEEIRFLIETNLNIEVPSL